MKEDAQLAFQLKRLKTVPSILIKMPISSRRLQVLPYKTKPQEQGTYGKQSNVSNGRPQETMLQGTGISTSGKAGKKKGCC